MRSALTALRTVGVGENDVPDVRTALKKKKTL